MKRSGVAYAALALFYCLDVFLTVALIAGGRLQELNPVNQRLLRSGGLGAWVAFRLATLFFVTFLVAASLSLTAFVLPHRAPRRKVSLDQLEDVVVGSITLFYAFAIFHNLTALAPLAGRLP